MTVLHDAQRADEFAAEERLASPEAGQRGQRRQQWTRALRTPEVALDTPDRDHGGGIDAEAPLHLVEHLRPAGVHCPAVDDTFVVDEPGQVVPDRRAELGLVVEQVEHTEIGRQPGRAALEGGARDAARGRRTAQPRQAPFEGRDGLLPGGSGGCGGGGTGRGGGACIGGSDRGPRRPAEHQGAAERTGTGRDRDTCTRSRSARARRRDVDVRGRRRIWSGAARCPRGVTGACHLSPRSR